MSQRKAWKLQEFVAHSPGSVTCLTMGKKSARVIATGGEDRRVKLWAVGKPSCIMSLTGHTSSVDSAIFNHNEDSIAAGSLSGSIRVWDLEEAKMVRALSGHASSVQTLDFHPHGNFIVSGSMDATVKLWDVSRKGCINTFRGHTGCVNMVKFSPDGNWVVSAGDDGRINVWDLSAGKMLTELTGHTAPVTGLAYHPSVLLLATASADRTVRCFDLETFTQVSVSGIELAASAVRHLIFHPHGICLYVATTEHLKIYNHETMQCLETVPVGWRAGGGLVDMAVASSFNQLIGASLSQSLVTTYVTDVKSCVPFVSPTSPSSNPSSPSPPTIRGPSLFKAGVEGQPSQARNTRPIIRCRSDLPAVRPNTTASTSSQRKAFCLRGDDRKPRVVSEETLTADLTLLPPTGDCLGVDDDDDDQISGLQVIDDVVAYNCVFKPRLSVLARSPSRQISSCQPISATAVLDEKVCPPKSLFTLKSTSCSSFIGYSDDDIPFRPPPIIPLRKPNSAKEENLEISNLESPINAVDPFSGIGTLMVGGEKDGAVKTSQRPPTVSIAIAQHTTSNNYNSDSSILQRLRTPHISFMQVMGARHKNLTTVRLMWPKDNLRTALESAILMQDQAVLVDVLRALLHYSKNWTLDLVALLLPQLSKLVWSKYSGHVETVCQAVRIILKNFASLIRQTINSAHSIGVDISHEERDSWLEQLGNSSPLTVDLMSRQAKCRTCLTSLQSIQIAFDSKDVMTKAGQCGREVTAMFSLLE